MNFDYKGEKYGLSFHGGEYYFYSQKMIDKNKPQIRLKAKTLSGAHKEVEKIIDNNLVVKK